MIMCEILLFFFIFGKKIHRVWDRSIKEFIISQNLKNKKGKLMATQYISKLKLQKKLFDNNKENKNRSQFSCYASNLRTEHCLQHMETVQTNVAILLIHLVYTCSAIITNDQNYMTITAFVQLHCISKHEESQKHTHYTST